MHLHKRLPQTDKNKFSKRDPRQPVLRKRSCPMRSLSTPFSQAVRTAPDSSLSSSLSNAARTTRASAAKMSDADIAWVPKHIRTDFNRLSLHPEAVPLFDLLSPFNVHHKLSTVTAQQNGDACWDLSCIRTDFNQLTFNTDFVPRFESRCQLLELPLEIRQMILRRVFDGAQVEYTVLGRFQPSMCGKGP